MIQWTLKINSQIIVLSCKILRDWCWQQKLRVSKLLMKKSKSNTEQLASILVKDWLQCVVFRKIIEYFVFCILPFCCWRRRSTRACNGTDKEKAARPLCHQEPFMIGQTLDVNYQHPRTLSRAKKRHTGPSTQRLLSRRGCMFNNTLWDCQTNIPNLTHAINIKYDDTKNN